jgi:hypothetical protein
MCRWPWVLGSHLASARGADVNNPVTITSDGI